MKFPTEILMKEVQKVALDTDELASQEKPHAYASHRSLCKSSFHWK